MVEASEIRSASILEGLSEAEIKKLAEVMEWRHFCRGDVIFRENQPGGKLFIIKEGEVSITRVIREGEVQKFNHLSSGMSFGGLSLIDGREHSATATAMTDCQVAVLDKVDFDRLAEKDYRLGIKLMMNITKALCTYLRTMNEKFIDMIQYVSLER